MPYFQCPRCQVRVYLANSYVREMLCPLCALPLASRKTGTQPSRPPAKGRSAVQGADDEQTSVLHSSPNEPDLAA